jgi:hypothetical protein
MAVLAIAFGGRLLGLSVGDFGAGEAGTGGANLEKLREPLDKPGGFHSR